MRSDSGPATNKSSCQRSWRPIITSLHAHGQASNSPSFNDAFCIGKSRLFQRPHCYLYHRGLINNGGTIVVEGFGRVVSAAVNPPLAAPSPHDRSKNRYVSFVPNSGSTSVAFKIDKTTAPVGTAWVGLPDVNGLAPVVTLPLSRVWSEAVVHVGDCEIVPVATYEIQATGDGGGTFTTALTVSTTARPAPKFWADTVGAFGTFVAGQWDPPNGVVNVNDYIAVLQKFLGVATAPHVTVVDVQGVSSTDPCLNKLGNIADVFLIIKAFQGNVYPFETNPANCPPCP